MSSKTMSDCYQFYPAHVAASCAVCFDLREDAVHHVGKDFYCVKHCPVHGAQAEPEEWDGEAGTIEGEQEELFK